MINTKCVETLAYNPEVLLGISEDNSNQDSVKALRKAIQQNLTARQRYCLIKHYCKNIGLSEIAKSLNLNVSTIYRHVQKAKKRITEVVQI